MARNPRELEVEGTPLPVSLVAKPSAPDTAGASRGQRTACPPLPSSLRARVASASPSPLPSNPQEALCPPALSRLVPAAMLVGEGEMVSGSSAPGGGSGLSPRGARGLRARIIGAGWRWAAAATGKDATPSFGFLSQRFSANPPPPKLNNQRTRRGPERDPVNRLDEGAGWGGPGREPGSWGPRMDSTPRLARAEVLRLLRLEQATRGASYDGQLTPAATARAVCWWTPWRNPCSESVAGAKEERGGGRKWRARGGGVV